jgi:hypothetical protein
MRRGNDDGENAALRYARTQLNIWREQQNRQASVIRSSFPSSQTYVTGTASNMFQPSNRIPASSQPRVEDTVVCRCTIS